MMKIAIDGKPLTFMIQCGVKRYAYNFLSALAEIDSVNQYIIYVPRDISIPKHINFTKKVINGIVPWQIRFAFAVAKDRVDIIHYLQQHGSIFVSHPRILTTAHDTSPKEIYPSMNKNMYYSLLGVYVRMIKNIVFEKSKALISVSNFTKQELITHHIQKDIFVVHNGVGKEFVPASPKLRNTVLAMTDFSERKNIIRTIQAYSLLSQSLRSAYTLTIILSMHDRYKDILAEVASKNLQKYVTVILNPGMRRIIGLYQHASVFLYPSLYEGFGLPILEAMASGCPVITSNYGAMREVAGSAALLVNPRFPEEIERAMEKILKSPSLQKKLRDKGLARARKFSWEQTAKKTLHVYEHIYQS